MTGFVFASCLSACALALKLMTNWATVAERSALVCDWWLFFAVVAVFVSSRSFAGADSNMQRYCAPAPPTFRNAIPLTDTAAPTSASAAFTTACTVALSSMM